MTAAFRALAEVLSPADEDDTALLELDDEWRQSGALPTIDGWALWGRLPGRVMSPLAAMRFAMRREKALRRIRGGVGGTPIRRLHRLPPPTHPGIARSFLRSILLQGAVAELARPTAAVPAYEQILSETGVGADSEIRVSRDGSVMIHGTRAARPVVLRMGRAGGSSDPSIAADALEHLQAEGISLVPSLVGRGQSGRVSWSVETSLRGHAPTRLNEMAWREVMVFLASLARADGRITAVADHASMFSAILPAYQASVLQAAGRVSEVISHLPSVIQHGDLFGGNLLVDGEHLTGVIDWATWSRAGTPGVDLLELYANEIRHRKPAQFASILASETWASAEFLHFSAPYWPTVGVEPSRANLRAIAVAWWLTGMTTLLARPDRQALRESAAWLSREVEEPLEWIGRSGQ